MAQKIALVGPELEENLGLRYLHSALSAAGHEPRIFDFHSARQTERVVRDIIAFEPDVVGLSIVFTSRAQEFLDLAAQLRAAGYCGHITSGGQFASLNAAAMLADFPQVDSVVRGEGEEAIVDLLAHMDDLQAVAGLSWRDADGAVRTNADRPNPDDLDLRERPWRDAFPRYLGLPIANILSSRGCYANCNFCAINAWFALNPGKRFRQRDEACVAAEMADLYHRCGVRMFNFHDDNFLMPRPEGSLPRLARLRQEMDRHGIGRVALQIKARPDSIDERVVAALKELGLFRVFLGVESNAVAGLQTLGRGLTRDQNAVALGLLTDAGVHVTFNLLMFDPHTTLADLRDNINFIRQQASVPLNFCRAEVYSGTGLERMLREEGRLEGNYLGFGYKLADGAAQRMYELQRPIFRERNFDFFGMNNQAIGLDYHLHLLKHFWPDRCSPGLLDRAKEFIGQVNRSNADLLDAVWQFAGSALAFDEQAGEELTERLLAERRKQDDQFATQLTPILAEIKKKAETARKPLSILKTGAAASAAMLLLGTSAACDPAPSHLPMSEARTATQPVTRPDLENIPMAGNPDRDGLNIAQVTERPGYEKYEMIHREPVVATSSRPTTASQPTTTSQAAQDAVRAEEIAQLTERVRNEQKAVDELTKAVEESARQLASQPSDLDSLAELDSAVDDLEEAVTALDKSKADLSAKLRPTSQPTSASQPTTTSKPASSANIPMDGQPPASAGPNIAQVVDRPNWEAGEMIHEPSERNTPPASTVSPEVAQAIEKAKETVAACQNEVASLNADLATAKVQSANDPKNEVLQAQVVKTQAALAAAMAKLEKAQAELVWLTSASAGLSPEEARLTEVLKAAEAALENQQNLVAKLQQEQSAIKTQLANNPKDESLQASLAKTQAARAAALEQVDRSNIRIAAIHKQLAIAKGEAASKPSATSKPTTTATSLPAREMRAAEAAVVLQRIQQKYLRQINENAPKGLQGQTIVVRLWVDDDGKVVDSLVRLPSGVEGAAEFRRYLARFARGWSLPVKQAGNVTLDLKLVAPQPLEPPPNEPVHDPGERS